MGRITDAPRQHGACWGARFPDSDDFRQGWCLLQEEFVCSQEPVLNAPGERGVQFVVLDSGMRKLGMLGKLVRQDVSQEISNKLWGQHHAQELVPQ